MLINKKKNMTPYDMKRRPAKQYPFLMPIVWLGSWLMTRKFRLKIDRTGLKGVKPPYLAIATHQGFSDYYIAPLSVFPHRAMFVSDMEGFASFGNWLYRGLGCIPKRRYVSDIAVVKNIRYGLCKGQSVFVYPESRHSNAGTTSYIPKNIGKLAKMMNVPVVILSAKGSYLANPFWDESHTRKVPITAKMECICTAEELANISTAELQKKIEKSLQYDEYRYQQDNGILISDKNRAEGLQLALYRCKACKATGHMATRESSISCSACGAVWELTEDGWLQRADSKEKVHIPDWYEWQRKELIKEPHTLYKSYEVHIEALPNQYGFVDMGKGTLELNEREFVLTINGEKLHFPHKTRESVQTEYNYHDKGKCIVLSTKDCCYYIYSDDTDFQPTAFQFVGEYLHHGA